MVVPSRVVPVPDTVSPGLQNLLRRHLTQPVLPRSAEEWNAFVKVPDDFAARRAKRREALRVSIEEKEVGGVRCYIITPQHIERRNQKRLLLGLHAGAWVSGAGETGLDESMIMAALTGYKVVAVDYRTLPQHPFPAAMDDATRVWKELTKTVPPLNVGLFGSSAGGGMVLTLVQRAKAEGLTLPGAVVADSPWADLSKSGDTYYTNDGIDNVFTYDGFFGAIAKLYANGRDLKDPQVSPVYGDFAGFPPTFLVTGTRDAFLSNTVRVHARLRRAGVATQLVVEEGQAHGWLTGAAGHLQESPEAAEVYAELTRFFDTHLGH